MFLISLGIFLFLFTFIVFIIVSFRYTTKAIMILTLLVSSIVAYFMDNYNIVVNSKRVRNSFKTNFKESFELLNFKLFLYFFFLGVLPSILIYKVKVIYPSFKELLFKKIKYLLIALGIIAAFLLIFSKHYFSFFREHNLFATI